MSLFRSEVAEARRSRLHGEVVLTQPISTKLFAGALFLIVAIAAVWVTVGSYARIETVPGRLVTDIPSAKVIVPQTGVVVTLAVTEGQRVEKGDPLLVINSDRQAAAGGVVAGRSIGALEARQQLTEAQIAMARNRAREERFRLMTVIRSSEAQAKSLESQIATLNER